MSLFVPVPAVAATPLPDGYEKEALIVRRFILDAQQSVQANEVARRRMLKEALHAHINEAFGETLEALVDGAVDGLMERLAPK